MKTVLLGDLIDIKHGYAFKGEHFSDRGDKIVVTPGNFYDSGGFKYKNKEKYYVGNIPEEFIFNKGDLAIAMTEQMAGLLGSSLLIPESDKFLHNQRIGSVNIKDNSVVDKIYLYYLFNAPYVRQHISSMATGTKIRHTSPSSIYKLSVALPEINEQKVIGQVLNSLDEKIKMNQRMDKTLEQIGQSIFKHYFIDNPEANDWDKQPLDQVAEFLNGLAMQKFPGKGGPTLPVIKIREMSSGITDNTDIASAEIPEKYIVHDGDILFSWSGTLIVKPWCGGDGALNQHLFKVTSSEYPKWFYYYWLKYYLYGFIEIAAGKATTMGHIQRRHLTEAKVKVPPDIELQEINKLLKPVLEQQILNELQNRKLASLRDSLLPNLISGKIKV